MSEDFDFQYYPEDYEDGGIWDDDEGDEGEEEEEEDNEVMKEYKKYWQKEYGIDPDLADRAKFQREAQIRREGKDTFQKKKQVKFSERLPEFKEKQAKHVLNKLKCSNISMKDKLQMDPNSFIRLEVKDQDNVKHVVCYDVVKLYNYLVNRSSSLGVGETFWIDPIYRIAYTKAQKDRIKTQYAEVSCLKPLFKMDLIPVISKKIGKMDQVSFPKAVLNKILEDDLLRSDKPLIFKIVNKRCGVSPTSTITSNSTSHNKNLDDCTEEYVTSSDFNAPSGTIQVSPELWSKIGIHADDILTIEECNQLKTVKSMVLKGDWQTILGVTQGDLDNFMDNLKDYFKKRTVVKTKEIINVDGQDIKIHALRDSDKKPLKSGIVVETDINLEFK